MSDKKIKEIKSREILDSRGNPTVETRVVLESGITAKASVPSGASTGVHEAIEMRDGDEGRYGGKGVLKAVKNVNEKISKAIRGMDATDIKEIDEKMIDMDGSDNKQNLGANAILSVSLACARAGSLSAGKDLFRFLGETFEFDRAEKMPKPCFNIFNGGKHADTNLDFQEFMLIPLRKNDSDDFVAEQVRMGSEIFHCLGDVLRERGFDTDVGAEGGYAPDISSSVQAVELIITAIMEAGYEPGKDAGIGLDVGSSEIYDKKTGKYTFKLDNFHFESNTLIGLYNDWFRDYPIVLIEDGLAEDDWKGWAELTDELGDEMILVGDDLFTTNPKRLKKGVEKGAANTVLIKPNQIGTLSEAVECIKLARKNNYKVMASHRSGETCDSFIADLAVAANADYIKAGSLSRGERLAKYNRLIEIEMKIFKKF